ncbi:MAG: transposase [Candidatus Thermoplasmatota archaeon]|jgi:hypothetical protein|nr:transposase [Candidatus Thermoplasmatota archaeon]MCL5800265.1 transposase [Candidatus Thermoplasmatota archaeon]
MDFHPDLIRKIERYFGLAGVLLAVAIALYFVYGIFSDLAGTLFTIRNNPYYSNAGGPPILMEASVIGIPIVIAVLYYFIEVRDGVYERFAIMRVFAILISSNLLLTVTLPVFISPPPAGAAFSSTPLATVMVIIYQNTYEFLELLLLPILAVAILYMIVTGGLSARKLVFGIVPRDFPALGIAAIAWVPAALIFGLFFFSNGGDVFSYMVLALEFFVITYSFIRFGLPAAAMLYFSLMAMDIVSAWSAAGTSQYASTVSLSVGLFILVWAFIGITSIFAALFTFMRDGASLRVRNATARAMSNGSPRHTISPWINSSCPSCGSVTYKINPDGSLTCLKCGQVIDKDAEGPMNVRIDIRSSRF